MDVILVNQKVAFLISRISISRQSQGNTAFSLEQRRRERKKEAEKAKKTRKKKAKTRRKRKRKEKKRNKETTKQGIELSYKQPIRTKTKQNKTPN